MVRYFAIDYLSNDFDKITVKDILSFITSSNFTPLDYIEVEEIIDDMKETYPYGKLENFLFTNKLKTISSK